MSDNNTPAAYPAAWYPDPNVEGQVRYYDGTQWTEHVQPAAGYVGSGTPGTAGTAAPVNPTTATPVVAEPVAKKPWYKRKGIVIPVGIVAGIILISSIGNAIAGGGSDDADAKPAVQVEEEKPVVEEEEPEPVYVTVPNLVGMSGNDARAAVEALGLKFKVEGAESDMAQPVGAQHVNPDAQLKEGDTVIVALVEKPKLTLGQQNAVDKAQSYLAHMGFSRAGLFGQLTSEYGEQYPAEDAEFALAYLEANGLVDWNAEAVEKAKSYLDHMSFSRDGLFDQLTSEYGEQFTADQANYALSQVGY